MMQTPEEKASARKTYFGFIQFEERFNFLPKNGPCVILLSYQYYQKPFSSKFSLVLRNSEQVSYERMQLNKIIVTRKKIIQKLSLAHAIFKWMMTIFQY